MALQTTNNLTYDDYVLIPDDGLRHEIIEGEHWVNPAPNVRHQRISGRLLVSIASFLDVYRVGEVLPGRLDVVLSQHDVVQPDIVYLVTVGIDADFVDGAPDLVIEILMTDSREHDEVRKLALYDKFEVPEYWIVDPESNDVKIYRRVNRSLTLVETVNVGGMITTPLLPRFSVAAQTVFA